MPRDDYIKFEIVFTYLEEAGSETEERHEEL